MKQLLLALPTDSAPTLDNFEPGRNQELLALLQRHAHQGTLPLAERFITLWGDSGAGKTHLLRALAQQPASCMLSPASVLASFEHGPAIKRYLIDDVDRMSAAQQQASFALFNQVREHHGALIAAAAAAPAQLQVREDLRTRLGWGLVYQVQGLSDDEKIAALGLTAHSRGFTLASGVLPYLITHYRRDMRSLSAMLDALDQYSLETKRPITLPLLRALLQQEGAPRA